MTSESMKRAIDIVGSQKKLADICGVAQPTVWRWVHGSKIDAAHVIKIVKATKGQVTVWDLRPDLGPFLEAEAS